MQNPPDEVHVLGKRWHLINNNKRCKKEKVYGTTIIAECLMYYRNNTTPSQVRDTVLHELLHSLELSLGLELAEHQVYSLSAVLYGTFADNPKLTRWLFGDIIEGIEEPAVITRERADDTLG